MPQCSKIATEFEHVSWNTNIIQTLVFPLTCSHPQSATFASWYSSKAHLIGLQNWIVSKSINARAFLKNLCRASNKAKLSRCTEGERLIKLNLRFRWRRNVMYLSMSGYIHLERLRYVVVRDTMISGRTKCFAQDADVKGYWVTVLQNYITAIHNAKLIYRRSYSPLRYATQVCIILLTKFSTSDVFELHTDRL